MPTRREAPACGEVADLLEAFVDGELDPTATAAIEAHLARCAPCREQRRAAYAVREWLRALPEYDTPERVLAAVRRTVAAETARPSARSPRWAWRTAAAAALVVAAAIGVLWWHGSQRAQTPPPSQVAEATAQARLALHYVAEITRHVGLQATRSALVENLLDPALRSVGRDGARTVGATSSPGAAGRPGPARDRSSQPIGGPS